MDSRARKYFRPLAARGAHHRCSPSVWAALFAASAAPHSALEQGCATVGSARERVRVMLGCSKTPTMERSKAY
ncbi:hypothetical protein B0H12DRAFT_1166029 [Mycena haematopus]|nr:hypothetical protein B0H12DRAFT_1166029 [Mycena haematopus]